MATKRSRKQDDKYPSKKRHVEANDENIDSTNSALVQASQPSQLVLNAMQKAGLRSGKIKKIHLRNFMCHANFELDFNTNVNVIVGLNGSGKSAILTALAIGLGSKASSTSRSTNLKELVKQGETSATIEITLTNDGLDAYEEDVYGDEIIVSRSINGNSGASTYKIKTKQGKVICTTRQDLMKLTMYLNIQVENPVLILNQDAARSFLKECDPKKLYTLFLKATQIETIIEKLQSCMKCAVSSKAQLKSLDRSIKISKDDIAAIKERKEKLQSIGRLRAEIDMLQNELNWSKVTEAEKVASDIEGKHKEKLQLIAKFDDFIKNKSKYDKQLKEKIRDSGTEFAQISTEFQAKTTAAEDLRTEYEKYKDTMSTIESAHRVMVERMNVIIQNVNELEANINERESNPQNIENVRKENEKQIQVLEKKIEDVGPYLKNALRDNQQFSDTLAESRDYIESAKQNFAKIQSQAQRCSTQIRQLKGSKQDALSAYGQSMSRLVARIEDLHRKNRFTEMPRGPLGRYIEVTDKKYKSIVENILEGTLQAFTVSCDKDRLLLVQTLKEFPDLSSTQIITGAFHHQIYDVRNGMVRLDGRKGKILMDVIKVSDPVVMNCLIDQRKIESVVIVETTDEAVNLTQNTEDVPQNLLRVIMMNPMSEYYPAPNYRSYAMKEKPVRYIQTNNKELIAGIEKQKEEFEEKLRHINLVVKKAEADVREKTTLVTEKKNLINELRQKTREYQQKIDELKAIEYPPEDEIEYLRQELVENTKRQKMFEEKIEASKIQLEEQRARSNELEDNLRLSREDVRACRERMTRLQILIENTQQQIRDMSNEIKLKENQLKDFKYEEIQLNTRLVQAQNEVQTFIANCKSHRVACNQPEQNILIKIKSLETRIGKIEATHDNIADVELLLENKKQELDHMLQIQDVLGQVLTKLEAIRQSRFLYVRRLRQHMSIRCQHKFSALMQIRKFDAEVLIDHSAKTLALKVIPRDSKIANAVSNTKSLSGGERSYSTVAFLIALWSCVEHPFYMLDEYDVFSDEHNRHMMTTLLFNEAKNKSDKQYCFLTPQDFSNIQASETITIHKLQDPERKK